jgi:hypothetical protein
MARLMYRFGPERTSHKYKPASSACDPAEAERVGRPRPMGWGAQAENSRVPNRLRAAANLRCSGGAVFDSDLDRIKPAIAFDVPLGDRLA